MSLEFRYSVVSTNVDGDRSTARFTNARSAFMWAKRLQEEGVKFEVFFKPQQGIEFAPVTISMKDLKVSAGSAKQTTRRKHR